MKTYFETCRSHGASSEGAFKQTCARYNLSPEDKEVFRVEIGLREPVTVKRKKSYTRLKPSQIELAQKLTVKINEYIITNNITIQEFARKIGVSWGMAQQYMRGVCLPRTTVYLTIVKTCGFKLEELI